MWLMKQNVQLPTKKTMQRTPPSAATWILTGEVQESAYPESHCLAKRLHLRWIAEKLATDHALLANAQRTMLQFLMRTTGALLVVLLIMYMQRMLDHRAQNAD